MAIEGVTHVGVCVSDLDRSMRFYTEGLGFELLRSFDIDGKAWGRVMEVDNPLLHSRVLRRDGLTIELLQFETPGHLGPSERRPLNQLGFTHLAIWVDDIDVESQRVVALGGHIVEDTRTVFDDPGFVARWLYCTDPDGIRLELIEYPDGLETALS
jgi:catechol 2,3-dioxygenase-like lactoylglutathione lyase family enzyme